MQQEKFLFKVWNCHRTKKVIVILSAQERNMYEQLILKANHKLEIDGAVLTLESDGTVIDDDEALVFLHKETFTLLQRNELWKPSDLPASSSSHHLSDSTLTVCSNSDTTVPVTNDNNNDTVVESNVSTDIIINRNNIASNDQSISFNSVSPDSPGNYIIYFPQNADVVPDQNVDTPHSETFESTELVASSSMVTEDTWRNFIIPWQKLPKNILQDLEKGHRTKSISREVTHMVINEMRVLKTQLSKKIFRIIAHKILTKFPKTFKDLDDDGVVLGDGSHSLIKKLEERNSYLNSLAKRKRPRESNELEEGKKKQRKLLAAKAGCINWSPSLPVRDEDNQNQVDASADDYPAQREFLNKTEPPSIDEIRKEWPVLLTVEGIKSHYKKLMGTSIDDLEKTLKEKAQKIINFAGTKKIKIQSFASDEERCIEALRVASLLLKEDLYDFLHVIPHKEDVKNIKICNPCIVAVKEKDTNSAMYYVAIEKEIINEENTSFLCSLQQCYACYYNFNMRYPQKFSSTLEFIQRYLMKTHPDQGTKSQTFSASKRKVLTLLKNLADYDLSLTSNHPSRGQK